MIAEIQHLLLKDSHEDVGQMFKTVLQLLHGRPSLLACRCDIKLEEDNITILQHARRLAWLTGLPGWSTQPELRAA